MSATDGSRSWDLTAIYEDLPAWEAQLREVQELLPELVAFDGRLHEGPQLLASALECRARLDRLVNSLETYARLLSDQDTRNAGPRGMLQRAEALSASLAESAAFLAPELLGLAHETLASFLEEEPRLHPFRRLLEQIERLRDFTLGREAEDVLGKTRRIVGGGLCVSDLLRDTEIPWPTVSLSDGSDLRLDPSGYSIGRTLPVRSDRLRVFEAFHGTLRSFKASLGASLHSTIKEHLFFCRARGYPSCLAAALHENEVDETAYHMLLAEVNGALPALHRYLRLRARILALDDLAYHDIYAPLVDDTSSDYSWDGSRRQVLESVAPLGESYTAKLSEALHTRWVDVDRRPGKRAGAYVHDGAFDAHPYMLLNHTNDFHGASTLAHESGHLMHSCLSQETQAYPTARYVIFVAEVASTFGEALFFHHSLDRAQTREQRLSLLGNYLENIRGTVFRQAMFAEFEFAVHSAVERNESLTGDDLSRRYLDLLRRYHGSDQDVVRIDEVYGAEWAFVPHFHYNYYVYQYATSFVAATALSRMVLRQEAGAVERYLEFLGSGCSHPPVELLRRAGVDMTSPDPIRATMSEMNEIMDQIEELL